MAKTTQLEGQDRSPPDADGLGQWFYRKKPGGSYRNAPTMADIIQWLPKSGWMDTLNGVSYP
ncbi:MAG TPA: hypothetical protein VMU04_11530, partial [Candidatus Acidoferrum sp.]|nr:hypothetical protein [Candidatus Acidoferrum sp.]